jgi:serine/threonine protein kinase
LSRLAPGNIIEGKYQVLRRLRAGGMGELYLVRHQHLQEQRVIKVLRADIAGHQDAASRFQREAQLATHVKHPRVATLHDFSALPDGSFYMVWEYIEGQDVGSWLREKGVFPVLIAVELGVQALAGLDAIHRAQIVHRDISPDNLMITVDSRGRLGIKIIDLGLAKNLGDVGLFDSQEGSFGGKLNYCSPEHVGLFPDVRPDRLSDLYCFAIVLYQMITGELPFERLGPGTGLIDRFQATPPLVSRRNPKLGVPSLLDPILAKALAYERLERFPAASSFREALEEAFLQLRAGNRPPPSTIAEDTGPMLQVDARAAEEQAESGEEDSIEVQKHRFKVLQTRELVEQYLATRQEALARLSLASLLELDPEHPEAELLDSRIKEMVDRQARNEETHRLGQRILEAAERGEVEQAEQGLAQLGERAPNEAAKLKRKVNLLTERYELDRQVAGRRRHLDALIAAGRTEEAEAELRLLAALEVPKVVLDLYRAQIGAARQSAPAGEQLREARREVEGLIARRQWQAARDKTRSLEVHLGTEATAVLLRQVAELEADYRRRGASEEAADAIDALLHAREHTQAMIALRVLRRLDPHSERLGELEARLERLEAEQRAG